MNALTFSFDIGYASIGWSVIENKDDTNTLPSVLGTGVVLFESDACLASERRKYRRMRRTIRARRKRIERMSKILIAHKVLTQNEVSLPGHPAPFFLAARALQGKHTLNAQELWHVLRWYAHNRGYDGNKQWSSMTTESAEDTERVTMAKDAMMNHGKKTMAETITAILNLNTEAEAAEFSVTSPKYKKLNLAFPREIVEAEVQAILSSTPTISDKVKSLLIGSAADYIDELSFCGIQLPKRYHGSILFGQLIPRFDNRIIARCPITWAHTYQRAMEEGKSEKVARQEADKLAKVPKADCAEYYEYRFARILANIRVNNAPLSAEIRNQLMKLGKKKGRFTKTDFTKAVRELTGDAPNNLKNYFHLVPKADEALILVPFEQKYKASGRAPYARPVLREVIKEVLRGEDPAKPALSLEHPFGEKKLHDGILYATLNPNSDVYRLQQKRNIEKQTNNHLVRHRLLIFEKLLGNMLEYYANSNPALVKQCCIEVNRELREFSGLKSNEIQKQLKYKIEDFQSAVKYLNEKAPLLIQTAGIIRKCRIAMDMNWTCPYTGMKYGPNDLPRMDKEHIVPYAARNTNAMSALVLTFPEVNKMKGKRTAMEFIIDCQGQSVVGKENLQIWTEKRFKSFVEKLDTKGAPDDKRRKEKRKKLLLVETLSSKGDKGDLGFTEGQLTQSSQLSRMAFQVAKRTLKNATLISIPGQVTAEVRKAWKLMGTLAKTVPDVKEESSMHNAEGNDGAHEFSETKIKEKALIRKITHLHHAVDACTLGLIPLLIPSGTNGVIWKLLAQRQLNERDKQTFRIEGSSPILALTEKNRIYLKDVPKKVKLTIEQALNEKRVVRHVPADMSGAKFNEQYSGVIDYETDEPKLTNYISLRMRSDFYGVAIYDDLLGIPRREAQAYINEKIAQGVPILQYGQVISISGLTGTESNRNGQWQIASIEEKKKKIKVTLERTKKDIIPREWKSAPICQLWSDGHIKPCRVLPVKQWIQKSKVMGLKSPKMKKNSAILTITDNYGAVISPTIEIIRHVSVYKTISKLKHQFPNKPIQLLRPGMIISITNHKNENRNGKWRIASVKDNAKGPALDLQRLEASIPAATTSPHNWINVSLNTLCNSGLIVHKKSYIE